MLGNSLGITIRAVHHLDIVPAAELQIDVIGPNGMPNNALPVSNSQSAFFLPHTS